MVRNGTGFGVGIGTVFIALAALAASAMSFDRAWGAVVTETVLYDHEGTTLEGYLAYDDTISRPVPGVLIVHQWMGLSENEKMRARMLAELGYVAFACDVYGKGVRPANQQEAAAEASKYYADRGLLRTRVARGLEWLRAHEAVDGSKTAAIGYCFGGGAVLELARSGAELSGVVSFHGSLDTPNPEDAKNIRCPLLVLHGDVDPYVDDSRVQAFREEMRAAKVDFQFVAYSGAVHAFTQKSAGDDPSKGAAYNAKADARSWRAMQSFFDELFR